VSEVVLRGHPTWAHVPSRNGQTVLLLHGGMSSSASLLNSIGPRLKRDFRVAAFDRRGHGRTADTEMPFSYEDMADETIAFLEYLDRRCHIVGHSDGGIVALIVALRRPDLVRRMVAVGANYHFSGLHDMPEMDLRGPYFAEWAMKYGAVSPDGPEHAVAVANKTALMQRMQPNLKISDLRGITVPTLIMAGDDDIPTLAHTCSMYEAIPNAQLAIIPGTSHMVLKERTKESARVIRRFLRGPQTPLTLLPVRRGFIG
jgi:pimeloyl-ACP methyl ester carboxylesterase